MENYKIETHHLSKKYGAEIALADVSLHIRTGKIYGLLGPNGAGKSTLLKIISGMIRPSSGYVLISGEAWKREHLSQIGSLIEAPAIYNNLSAWDNLKVLAYVLDITDERIRQVLALVDLEKTGKKRAGSFSMGMKQRLGIAMALLNQPAMLILDEPSNGLDPVGIQDLRRLLITLAQGGMTIILSSHILSEVAQVADDIGIISHGRLGYEGPNSHQDLESLFMQIVQAHGERIGGNEDE